MNDITSDFIKEYVKKQDDFIRQFLTQNYPDLDLNNAESVQNIIESESISIEIYHSPVCFDSNIIKQTCTIRITKNRLSK